MADLSRVVSHALRHEPWLYELELDEAGWVSVQSLVEALR
ncbi:MAG: RNA 2'-phosphotransferase, partial [Cellulomonadaceae bacterium]|nr:RNA 2'-phosphotransferase [Cellulomonadaceae bacterium]